MTDQSTPRSASTPPSPELERLIDAFQMAVSTYIEWPGVPDEAPTEAWQSVCAQLSGARAALRDHFLRPIPKWMARADRFVAASSPPPPSNWPEATKEHPHNPATPSSPESRKTTVDSRFTGGSGYYASCEVEPERPAPDLPAELTEALIAHERLCMEDLRAAFGAEDASRAIEPVTTRILDSRSALLALYNRQREEIERLTAQTAASLEEQSWLVKELSRLRTDRGVEDQIMALDQQIGMLQAENTSLSSQLERLTSERKAIAQEFGVSEDFDLGEHTRVVMASLDDFRTDRERLKADADRWGFYASSPQTALMLGSKLDPNDPATNWAAECNGLADTALRLRSLSDQKND